MNHHLLLTFVILFIAAGAVFCGCRKAQEIPPFPENAALIDVRSAEEFARSRLQGAINIPHGLIAEKIASAVPDKETPLYLYCRSGRRVKIAIGHLRKLGYTQLRDLESLENAARILGREIIK